MLMPMPTDDQAAAAPGGRDYGATLWEPSERSVRGARITGYLAWLRDSRRADLDGYDEFWRWSVTKPEEFWASVWDYFEVLGHRGDGPVLSGGPMPDVSWFGGATLNYARNALRTARTQPDRTAVIFRSESGRSGTLSFGQLAAEVARVRAGLRALGVTRSPRVTPRARRPARTRATSAASCPKLSVPLRPDSERKITAVRSGCVRAVRRALRA